MSDHNDTKEFSRFYPDFTPSLENKQDSEETDELNSVADASPDAIK